MACETWLAKLDAYVDGELPSDEARALNEHLRSCARCAAEALQKVQLKRAVQTVGQQFSPDPAFRARIQKSLAVHKPSPWKWRWMSLAATVAAVLLMVAVLVTVKRNGEQQLMSELVDQHVATLASPNPVDVVSTDRHTVKPWFAGKIPFTFNLPELQDSPFVLVGGRVSYLNQSPGAELIFKVRQHQISAFIFQEKDSPTMGENGAARTALSFEVRSWRHNGLRYFVIGDASAQDLDRLSELLKAAG